MNNLLVSFILVLTSTSTLLILIRNIKTKKEWNMFTRYLVSLISLFLGLRAIGFLTGLSIFGKTLHLYPNEGTFKYIILKANSINIFMYVTIGWIIVLSVIVVIRHSDKGIRYGGTALIINLIFCLVFSFIRTSEIPKVGDNLTYKSIEEDLYNHVGFYTGFFKENNKYVKSLNRKERDRLYGFIYDEREYEIIDTSYHQTGFVSAKVVPKYDVIKIYDFDNQINFFGYNYPKWDSDFDIKPSRINNRGMEFVERLVSIYDDYHIELVEKYPLLSVQVTEIKGKYSTGGSALKYDSLSSFFEKRPDGENTLYITDFYIDKSNLSKEVFYRKMKPQITYFGESEKTVLLDIRTNELLDIELTDEQYRDIKELETIWVAFIGEKVYFNENKEELENKVEKTIGIMLKESSAKSVYEEILFSNERLFLESR